MLNKYISDLRKEFAGYNGKLLLQDSMAGLTVAAVAIPLALAFGVSSGADAAAGMITAIIAGFVIGGLSGASYQISGPTGAMSAILLSISAQYGIEGVMMAGFLSGLLLLGAALLRMGQIVTFIPGAVITGFTSGIAVIIALGQIDNFFGTTSTGSSTVAKLLSYRTLGFQPDWTAVLFGALVVLVMIVYPKKWSAVVPSSLVGIIIALVLNMILFPDGAVVAEVGEIPKTLMSPNGLLHTGFHFENVGQLLSPAISIATLGLIESLLCGACAGKMTGEIMDSQRELVAQGIGNTLLPLFGGVPATAAIARTSVAIKSGGRTRMVSIIHAVTLIASMFLLGNVMSRIPLASLAGVLIVTAWRMNEWESIREIFKNRWWMAMVQFTVTMLATIFFNLTIAIVVGVVFAMLAFVAGCCDLQVSVSAVQYEKLRPYGIEGRFGNTKVVYVVGPLFFATQDKLFHVLQELDDVDDIILSLRGVPMMEITVVNELKKILEQLVNKGVDVQLCCVQPKVQRTMEQVGLFKTLGSERIYWDTLAVFHEKMERQRMSNPSER